MKDTFELATLGVRAGQQRTGFQEHAEGLFLTSSFVFENAAAAAAGFAGSGDGYVYSRYTNPTVTMMQDRLAALEGGQACVATASGMSAILATAMVVLKAGDHVVSSNAIFGATVQLFSTLLAKIRHRDDLRGADPHRRVAAGRAAEHAALLSRVSLEPPRRDRRHRRDLLGPGTAGAALAVDNCLCTPALQRPLEAWRRPGDPLGDEVPRRPGTGARRRRRRRSRARHGRPGGDSCARRAPRSRLSTRG
jgi:O-succinylhomoserine sulfhydrylase